MGTSFAAALLGQAAAGASEGYISGRHQRIEEAMNARKQLLQEQLKDLEKERLKQETIRGEKDVAMREKALTAEERRLALEEHRTAPIGKYKGPFGDIEVSPENMGNVLNYIHGEHELALRKSNPELFGLDVRKTGELTPAEKAKLKVEMLDKYTGTPALGETPEGQQARISAGMLRAHREAPEIFGPDPTDEFLDSVRGHPEFSTQEDAMAAIASANQTHPEAIAKLDPVRLKSFLSGLPSKNAPAKKPSLMDWFLGPSGNSQPQPNRSSLLLPAHGSNP